MANISCSSSYNGLLKGVSFEDQDRRNASTTSGSSSEAESEQSFDCADSLASSLSSLSLSASGSSLKMLQNFIREKLETQNGYLSEETLETIADMSKGMKVLDLSNIKCLKGEEVAKLVGEVLRKSQIKAFEERAINSDRDIPEGGIPNRDSDEYMDWCNSTLRKEKVLFAPMPYLEELSLSRCDVTTRALGYICVSIATHNMSTIRSLDLSYNPSLKKEAIFYISKCTLLQDVNLSHTASVLNSQTLKNLQSLPNLRSLHIDGIQVQKEDATNFEKELHALKRLHEGELLVTGKYTLISKPSTSSPQPKKKSPNYTVSCALIPKNFKTKLNADVQ